MMKQFIYKSYISDSQSGGWAHLGGTELLHRGVRACVCTEPNDLWYVLFIFATVWKLQLCMIYICSVHWEYRFCRDRSGVAEAVAVNVLTGGGGGRGGSGLGTTGHNIVCCEHVEEILVEQNIKRKYLHVIYNYRAVLEKKDLLELKWHKCHWGSKL